MILACIDIKMISDNERQKNLRWSLGQCSSGNNDKKYYRIGEYIERCCLVPGEYILTCNSSDYSLGWKDTKLIIAGHSYCDDFITFTAMRKINIPGNKSNLNCLFLYFI